jgi:hypothetical protein
MTSLRVIVFLLFTILILALLVKPCWFGIIPASHGSESFDPSLKRESETDYVDKQQPVDVIATLPTTTSHDCVSNGLVSSEGGAVCLSSSTIDLIKSRGGNYA